jgi:serine/threonine-protein kinase 11
MAYLILEWASFGSLQSLVGLVSAPDAIASIFRQITNGLAYLHQQSMVHRDIKPSNILLFSGGIAKLSDFGIGHSFDSTDTVVGTPAYQAPEFFDESGDVILDAAKEDIWSLGVSLYEATFGHLPYDGESMYQISWNIKHQRLVIPTSAPEQLRELISGMLEVNPENRWNLSEVMAHPFLSRASDTFDLDIPARAIPRMTSSKSMVNIAAVVCDEGYTFACTKRSFSWSGFGDPDDPVDQS